MTAVTDASQTTLTRPGSTAPGRLNLPPLKLGPLTIDVPVVLAPMAGITNTAFRRLCREYGGGLYVNEMVTARALVERRPESLRIIHHDPDETPARSSSTRWTRSPPAMPCACWWRRTGPITST